MLHFMDDFLLWGRVLHQALRLHTRVNFSEVVWSVYKNYTPLGYDSKDKSKAYSKPFPVIAKGISEVNRSRAVALAKSLAIPHAKGMISPSAAQILDQTQVYLSYFFLPRS